MSAYTKGVKNAKVIGEVFGDGDVIIGSATINQNATNVVVAHSLSAAPDFILLGSNENTATADRQPYLAASGTTSITLAHTDTDGATQTVFYLAGVLA